MMLSIIRCNRLFINRNVTFSVIRPFSQAAEDKDRDKLQRRFDDSGKSASLTRLQRLIADRRYLITTKVDGNKLTHQYSPEFFDFVISCCREKANELDAGTINPTKAAQFVSDALHSMELSLKELKKRKPPRSKFLEEMSRLYLYGMKELSEDKDQVKSSPIKVNKILCRYANACCSFDFDPSPSNADLWPLWFQVAKIYLEEVDSDVNCTSDSKEKQKVPEDFSQAYAYILSIIIDVTLRFRRFNDFNGLKIAWESRIAQYLASFKERNRYILSLRMATLVRLHDMEFKHPVSRNLAQTGIQRSLAEYKYRVGSGQKPNRTEEKFQDGPVE